MSSADGAHTQTVAPVLGTTVYNLDCVGRNGNPYHAEVTVLSRADIDITALSRQPLIDADGDGYPDYDPADGSYDNVSFLAAVDGIPSGASAPFTMTFAGQTITGTVSQSGAVTTFSPALSFNNIMFGTHDAQLEIDLPEPGSIIEDAPITFNTIEGPYSPQNYTLKFLGNLPIRRAFEKSVNVVAVKLNDLVGPKNVVSFAQKAGISSPMNPVLSLPLF